MSATTSGTPPGATLGYFDAYGSRKYTHAAKSHVDFPFLKRNNVREKGWRIPTANDVNDLITILGASPGNKLKEAGTANWTTGNAGTNSSGMTLTGDGNMSSSWVPDNGNGNAGFWWLSDAIGYYMTIAYNQSTVTVAAGGTSLGYDVRLVRDVSDTEAVDYEGNHYTCVLIDNEIWMSENLKSTKLNTGANIPIITDALDWVNASMQNACCAYNNDFDNV
jgi:uncharacterized protein (TIGR02145 family)